ncbi:hypothetical protein V6N11_034364 [Hibiscus sabdariffa]|uniref:Uncharacterized protein n=1 Tax=Hibiscus sabdariffa TaxID=183260 RepID=A0ABR2NAS6_9ROSI
MEVNEHRKEMAGVLNETTSKCSQQCEVSSNSLFIELLILKEENKALREKVKMESFFDDLQNWVKIEIERRGAQDLDSAIVVVEFFTKFKKSEQK